MRIIVLVMAIVTMLLLYMLTIATGHASILSDYFWWIFGFNALALLVLLGIVGKQLWQLWQDGRKRVFGTRIAKRLALMFVLVTVLPGLFLFGVSAQFIRHSINSWFGNETEVALERSLNLSKVALEGSVEDALLRELDAADTKLQQRIPQQAPLGVTPDQDGDVAGRQSALTERDPAGLRRAQQASHFAGGGVQHLLLRLGAPQILAAGSGQSPDVQRRWRFLA